MTDPTRRLWGDLRARARYEQITKILPSPLTEEEIELLLILVRLCSDGEIQTLIGLIERKREQ